MRYEIPFAYFNASAKNVGLVPYYARKDATWTALEAPNDDAAFAIIVKKFAKKGQTVIGKSYVRRWRAEHVCLNDGPAPVAKLPRPLMDDAVILHRPHACAHTDDGSGYRRGFIAEVLGDYHFAIRLDGYPRLADFHIREFAIIREMIV